MEGGFGLPFTNVGTTVETIVVRSDGLTERARLYLPAFSQTIFSEFRTENLYRASLVYDGDL